MPRLDRMLNALKHPYTEYQVSRAKKNYRSQHPECECCGVKPTFFGRNNDVHHLVPVHVDPTKACDFNNFVSLCRHGHFYIGHLQNWTDYNNNVPATIKEMQALMAQAKKERKVEA